MEEKENSQHTEKEREQKRERDDCRRCQPKRRVGQGSMQPAGDRVGREGTGFLNTRRKKTKQAARGLERAESIEEKLGTGVKPGRG